MSDELSVKRRGDAHVFTLGRPHSGNSLSASLVEQLHAALDGFETGGGRVLILRGEGRNFCTGFDLSDVAASSDSELLLRFIRIEQLLARLWAAPFATIAVATGRVFGAGADLFAACSVRLALEGSSFSFPGAGFGLILGTRRLAERVGAPFAQHLVASGEAIACDTAVRVGLATDVVREVDVQAELNRHIAIGMRLDALTYRSMREAMGDASDLDADLAMLVRSASRPGLRDRIVAYRTSSTGPAPVRSVSVG